MKSVLKAFICIFCLFPVSLLYANGGYFGEGNLANGHLGLLNSEQLQIMDEYLQIDLYKGYAEVTVKYKIKNHGKGINARIGYPCIIYTKNSGIKKQEINDYSIFDGAEKLKTKYVVDTKTASWIKIPYGFSDNEEADDSSEKMEPKFSWYLSNISFSEGETKEIKIVYSSVYLQDSMYVSENDENSEDLFRYLLSVGSSWKGAIVKGRVVINARTVDASRIKIFPQRRFVRKDNSFIWEFADLEPKGKDDILISMNNEYSSFTEYRPDNQNSKYFKYDGRYFGKIKPSTIKASSTLKGNYKAENISDNSKDTSWVEGKDNEGIGEYVEFQFNKPVKISQVLIMNGYNKSKSLFEKNNRVDEIEIVINDKMSIKSVLDNAYTEYSAYNPFAYSVVDLKKEYRNIKKIKLTIRKVHRGTEYNDTCISEVMFLQSTEKTDIPMGR